MSKDFENELEDIKTVKQPCTIQYKTGSGQILSIHGRVTDNFQEGNLHFIIIDRRTRIPEQDIVSINGVRKEPFT